MKFLNSPQTPKNTIQIGQQAEKMACQYLKNRGFKLLFRNYRCKMGEIDLIMKDHHELVFIEVRYRRTLYYGASLESINYTKQMKLIRTANFYLLTTRSNTHHTRFDVVGIDHCKNQYHIHYLKNAIELR
jgi:putative endonuclease